MLGAVVLVLLTASVIGPLVVLRWREHQDERALAVGAEVGQVVNRVLGGESLIAINATGARLWRRGQIVLSVPRGYEWLLEEVSGPVLRLVPSDFDLVIPGGEGRAARPLAAERNPDSRNGRVTARAA